MDSSALYETGDEKTTTQYLVLGTREQPVLLQASVTIDPYVRLFSPYRREFLERLRHPNGQKSGQQIDTQGAEDKEPFISLQQFARGQTAQLSYCGAQNYDTAATAYQNAIASGFTNKVWLAEAHHKLGLAWEGKGEHEKAKAEMLQSLTIRPNTPEILNNLGTVYRRLGDKVNALASFEKAVTLRPNYAIARYNLAEAYEPTNPMRAISEYETYLALVEGIPDEAGRVAACPTTRQVIKTLAGCSVPGLFFLFFERLAVDTEGSDWAGFQSRIGNLFFAALTDAIDILIHPLKRLVDLLDQSLLALTDTHRKILFGLCRCLIADIWEGLLTVWIGEAFDRLLQQYLAMPLKVTTNSRVLFPLRRFLSFGLDRDRLGCRWSGRIALGGRA